MDLSNIDEQYTLSGRIKWLSFGLMGVGLLMLIIGLFTYGIDRVLANLLLNSVFFVLIALAGAFFIAAHRIGIAGWHIAVKRIPEAMSTFLPVGGAILLAILAIITLGHNHDIYHWLHEALYHKGSHHYDEVIAGKRAYLNTPFFLIRAVIYIAGWSILAYIIRKYSINQDNDPEHAVKYYKRTNTISAIFLVFFAVTSSTASWDWIMSIDTHWYSTLFGWYVFASLWVTGLAVMTLITIHLKKQGYLEPVNVNHFHDFGKYMFAFTVFWTYLWFGQYMLIWYGNIPEETHYFIERQEHYSVLFNLNIIVNFFVPFLVLMSVGAKRRFSTLMFAAWVIIFGHWIDFYLMFMPGILGEHWNFGLLEIGLLLGYGGLFIFIIFQSLTRASLVPVNHPLMKESVSYHS